MLSYHSDPALKQGVLTQLHAHAAADEIVKGVYWEDGKGCAVGCTVHSNNHAEYETAFGIPTALAHLEDAIFEGLPNAAAKEWPMRFMRAVPVGRDLGRVQWFFLSWLLTDRAVGTLCARAAGGDMPTVDEWLAAGLLSWGAAGTEAANVAGIAVDAARSAASAAGTAARGAARGAAGPAEWVAWTAMYEQTVEQMADKLIEILEAA